MEDSCVDWKRAIDSLSSICPGLQAGLRIVFRYVRRLLYSSKVNSSIAGKAGNRAGANFQIRSHSPI
jgi:hypothetical protein